MRKKGNVNKKKYSESTSTSNNDTTSSDVADRLNDPDDMSGFIVSDGETCGSAYDAVEDFE